MDELSAEARAYLEALCHPDCNLPPANQRPSISTTISVDNLVEGFGKWTENTSTSPSG